MQTHVQPKLPKNLVWKGSVWESTPTIIVYLHHCRLHFHHCRLQFSLKFHLLCLESIYFARLHWLNYFYPSTKQLFVSMCITAGKPTRKLPNQHRADTHSYYHLCSQASQEPEEESLGCSFGHSTGVFWNQHGTEEITGITFIMYTDSLNCIYDL